MKLILRRRIRSALRAFKVPESYEGAALDDRRERERLASVAVSARAPLRLHVGCGPRVLAGWVNVDLPAEPYETPDVCGQGGGESNLRGGTEDYFAIDITRGLPLPDASVEVIFHEDFLEHLSQRDAVGFLAEARRVLIDGGVHRVNSPNLASSMREHSDFSRGLAGTYAAEWDRWHHCNIFTPGYLEEIALLVGYSRVEFNARNASISRHVVSELRPTPGDRPEDGNLFADLVK